MLLTDPPHNPFSTASTQRGHRTASHVAGANPGFALPKHSVELVRCRLLSQGADMRRREFLTILSGAAMAPLVWPDDALAQQPRNSPTIGFLGTTTPTIWSANVAAFQNRLRELGWIDGRNVSIEYRWAEGRDDLYAAFAAEFVQRRVDVIVTAGTTAVMSVKKATSTIPIVFAAAGDPVRTGLVASLSRPGRQCDRSVEHADRSWWASDLNCCVKFVPALNRVAVLGNVDSPLISVGNGSGPGGGGPARP